MRRLLDFLCDPLLVGMDVDGENRLALHRKMLEKKRMLREVFTEFHHLFRKLDRQFLSGDGIKVELGSGVSPMRDSYPEVLATDIVYAPHLDRVINAEAMDLADSSVRVMYGQNCFHHFPHPDEFLRELDRVLIPGGGAILLEPYYGPLATFLFKRLFRTEGFDKTYQSWETPVSGPMNGANQALSYIVFIRDRNEYERKHPSLRIVHNELAGNYLKYLLSGGLNFRQLLPDSFTGFVGLLEKLISPLNRWIALHHIIVIRKVVA
ncbi:class I SAM-dependent methyltransferase [Candidatus Nitrotoga sp. 1052]|uniref:class I SAM-dependent methyltransferase n=1 Tax=Candidatus Nitrotoga sp. 1052 TaxID=2886964 RepID=UPI001EF6AA73|nr:methyltransferase domain-containing protein [Candidatus Nitrotoga sp. 1052]CAH1077452.1 Methyltransferase [Candidatus Nitrotoga sp. 1052]